MENLHDGRGSAFARGQLPFRGLIRNSPEWNVCRSCLFASNRFQVPHERPDVLREQIVGVAEDKSERFWIATSDHVLRVPRDKLLSGAVKAVDVRGYDRADGLESTEGVKRSQSVVSDSAERIWFSLRSGLSVVDPSQITDHLAPALREVDLRHSRQRAAGGP